MRIVVGSNPGMCTHDFSEPIALVCIYISFLGISSSDVHVKDPFLVEVEVASQAKFSERHNLKGTHTIRIHTPTHMN